MTTNRTADQVAADKRYAQIVARTPKAEDFVAIDFVRTAKSGRKHGKPRSTSRRRTIR